MAHYKIEEAKKELQDYISELKQEIELLSKLTIVTKKDGTEFVSLIKNFKLNTEKSYIKVDNDFLTLSYLTDTRNLRDVRFFVYGKNFVPKTISELKNEIDEIKEIRQNQLLKSEKELLEWDLRVEQVEEIYKNAIAQLKELGASHYITRTMQDLHSYKLV